MKANDQWHSQNRKPSHNQSHHEAAPQMIHPNGKLSFRSFFMSHPVDLRNNKFTYFFASTHDDDLIISDSKNSIFLGKIPSSLCKTTALVTSKCEFRVCVFEYHSKTLCKRYGSNEKFYNSFVTLCSRYKTVTGNGDNDVTDM